MQEQNRMGDTVRSAVGRGRKPEDSERVHGWGFYELRGPHGELKQTGEFVNLITRVGDQVYGERGGGVSGAGGAPTGMRLGFGTTSPAKTGTGSAIVTYVSGSQQAFEATYPLSALASGRRRITYQCFWDEGDVTQNDIAEVVLTNESPLTDVAGSSSNTIARALLEPLVDKGSQDTLRVTWNHDFEGQ